MTELKLHRSFWYFVALVAVVAIITLVLSHFTGGVYAQPR